MYLSCPKDFYCRQKKSIFNHMKSLLVTRNQFLRQEINSYDKKLKERNPFLSQEINSYRKKSILVTRNQFLSQEINSCHKKSFLLNSHPSVKLINSWQLVKPTKKFAWACTFRGNLVPRIPGNSPPCSVPSCFLYSPSTTASS